MPKITIYTTTVCPYCMKAKMLLQKKKASYEEVDVSDNKEREKMIKISNGTRSVPQIFIGDTHVGGCDDLYELESKGELDKMLAE